MASSRSGSPSSSSAKSGCWLVTANVTNWKAGEEWLFSKKPQDRSWPILCVQETKLRGDALRSAQSLTRSKQYRGHFSEATFGPKGGLSAGVAVLVPQHLGSCEVGFPHKFDGAFSSRFVWALVPGVNGRQMVVCSLYLVHSLGLGGANAELLQCLQDSLGVLGHSNWIVAADWNMDPRLLYASDICRISKAVIFAADQGGPTCFVSPEGNCIDFCLIGQDAYSSVSQAHRDFQAPIPSHVPVWVKFDGSALGDVRVIKRPRKLDQLITERPIDRVESAQFQALGAQLQDLASDIQQGSLELESAWSQWNDLAERQMLEWLHIRGDQALGFRGRGAGLRVKRVPRVPKFLKGCAFAPTEVLRLVAACKHRLIALLQMKQANLPGWLLLARKIRRVAIERQAELEPQIYEALVTIHLASLSECQVLLWKLSDKEKRLSELALAKRRDAWKAWQMKVVERDLGSLCRWAKPLGPPPVAAAGLEGRVSFNPDEVADHFLQQWSSLWVRPEVQALECPSVQLPVMPSMDLPPLTASRVQTAIRRKAGVALGPDSWSSTEMKALTPEAVHALACLLNLCEQHHQFPAASHDSIMVMLPKGQGILALSQRPIGILAKLYRVWASARNLEVKTWEKSLGDSWTWGAGPSVGPLMLFMTPCGRTRSTWPRA